MINVADNFNLAGSTKPLDSRDEFATLADMKACTVCNELHICYNKETQKQYQYSSSNPNDSTTGKWVEYTPGGGGGEGTITGATIGGSPVTESGGILQLPAYPSVPLKGIKDSNGNDITPDANGKVTLPAPPSVPIIKIKVDGESSDLPITDGRVVIPSTPVKGIKTYEGNALSPDSNGIVTLPQSSGGGISGVKQGNTPLTPDQDGVVTVTDFTPDITNIKNTLQQIANSEPVVIPPSAINLPTTGTFNYDSGNTYVMNVDSTQIATIHYPYTVGSTDYVAFKAIDRDLYYVYSVSSNGVTYAYSNQYTWSTLPAAAKSKFESGIYAVKQTINNDGSIPDGHWVHGVPSVFVTRHNYPLTYRQITETVGGDPVHYILIKNDEINKIYKYQSSIQNNVAIWSQVTGGCYTKGDTTTGATYTLYDKYFDTANAVNVEYGSSNVKAALDELYGNYTVVTSNLPTMSVSDSIPTPTKNTYYDYGATPLSIVNVSGIPITNTNEVVIRFLTHSSNACTLVLDDTSGYQQRIIGSTTLAKGKLYVLSILRGVVCICEAPDYEAPVVEESEETT